jgi:hypothetical protein
MLIYAGQNECGNWVWGIEPNDPNYTHIKAIQYVPKTIKDIESEYNLRIRIEHEH